MFKFKLLKKKNLVKNLAVGLSLCLSFEAIVSRDVFAAYENPEDLRSIRAVELRNLQRILKDTGATWEAGETEVSKLSDTVFQNMMGAYPAEEDREYLDKKEITKDMLDSYEQSGQGDRADYSWFIAPHTKVKNQGTCGSCYAFASCGACESYLMRKEGRRMHLDYYHKNDYENFYNNTFNDFDLSEQDIMIQTGCGCEGSVVSKAMNCFIHTGAIDERYCQYTGTNNATYQNKNAKRIKMGGWRRTGDPDTMKQALIKFGACVVVMDVYKDFMSYVGGIYRYGWGGHLGPHAVLLVGYDDDKQAFLVKNSFGTNWGIKGYFWIAYDQMYSCVNFGREGNKNRGRTYFFVP